MKKIKDITNEELASIVRVISATGLAPTREEKMYLEESAFRLEQLDEITNKIKKLIKKMGGYNEWQN